MAERFLIRQGELLPPISEVLTDPNNPGANLIGAVVRFKMRLASEIDYRIDREADVLDPGDSLVQYAWQEGDTDIPSIYLYRWVVLRNGVPQSYPTREVPLEIAGFEVAVDGLPWSTPTEAQRYTAAAEGAEPIRLQSILEDAADEVAKYASTAELDPVPRAYIRKAKRAELRIFDWLWKTEGGVLTSKRVGPISKSFDQKGAVARQIVKSTMGDFYTGIPAAGFVEREPMPR